MGRRAHFEGGGGSRTRISSMGSLKAPTMLEFRRSVIPPLERLLARGMEGPFVHIEPVGFAQDKSRFGNRRSGVCGGG
jgi:hypothetical protein